MVNFPERASAQVVQGRVAGPTIGGQRGESGGRAEENLRVSCHGVIPSVLGMIEPNCRTPKNRIGEAVAPGHHGGEVGVGLGTADYRLTLYSGPRPSTAAHGHLQRPTAVVRTGGGPKPNYSDIISIYMIYE